LDTRQILDPSPGHKSADRYILSDPAHLHHANKNNHGRFIPIGNKRAVNFQLIALFDIGILALSIK